jgi:hypothetical protein
MPGQFDRSGPRATRLTRRRLLVDVSPELWRTDLRVVDTITQPEASARTLGSHVVEQGRAESQPA